MSLKTFTCRINEHNYSFTAFKGTDGLNLLAEFLGYASVVLKLFSQQLSNDFSLKSVLDSSLQENAIDKIIDELKGILLVETEREKFIRFIKCLVKNCSCDMKYDLSQDGAFDLVFSANYDELFLLVKEVVVKNFFSQNFIGKMLANKLKNQQQTSTDG